MTTGIDTSPARVTNLRNPAAVQALMGGTAGQRLMASGWDVNVLRPVAAPAGIGHNGGPAFSANAAQSQAGLHLNGTLRREEWIWHDQAVLQTARERLVVTNELISRGLVMPLPNALGVLSIDWETIGDLEPAQLTMSGLDEADKDQIPYGLASMPIPMIHKEFTLNLRQLEAARRNGRQMDTTQASFATRKVAELIEQIIFTGANISANNGVIYGLLNHPNRNTGSLTGAWTGLTGAQILADVLAMLEKARLDNQFGPFLLFMPSAWSIYLQNDFKAESSDSIMQRLQQIPELSGIIPTNRLTNSVLLVAMSSDTIQMIDGLQPTLVEWDSRGGFEMNYKVIAIMLPRVRADYAQQSGIVHFS